MRLISVFFFKIYNNQKLLLAFIFCFALFTELIFLFIFGNIGLVQHRIPGTDYLNLYEPVADNILGGRGITIGGKASIQSPPGYPIFLAAIFKISQLTGIGRLGLITVFNIFIAAAAACFLFFIAELIFNKKIALVSSFLWMSYPFNLWFIKNPNTEVLFIFLLFLAVWLYFLALKKDGLGLTFLSGVLLGLTALIRPIGLLLPLIFFLFIFFLLRTNSKKKKIILASALLIGSLLAVLPWEGYVWVKTGQIIPLSDSGPRSIVDGLTFALTSGVAGDRAVVSQDILQLMERAASSNLKTISEIDNFLREELINQPVSFFKLLGLKLTRAWYATSQKWWEGKILIIQLFYLLTGFIGIIYAMKAYKDKILEIIFLLSIVFYFWGMATVGLSILRYMVPAMGTLMIFSAVILNTIIEKLVKNRP